MVSRNEIWTEETILRAQHDMKSLSGTKEEKFLKLKVILRAFKNEEIFKESKVQALELNGKYTTKLYHMNDISHILKPPKYNHEWLADPGLGLPNPSRCPNYLINFDVSDVIRSINNASNSETTAFDASNKFAYDLFRVATEQSRIGNIYDIGLAWALTAISTGIKCYSLTLLYHLIESFERLPFNITSEGHIVYEDSRPVSSLLPLLMYLCYASIQARVSGIITEYEELLALNQAIEWTKTGFQSEYLKWKGYFTEWVTKYYELKSAGKRIVPRWNMFGMFIGGYPTTYFSSCSAETANEFMLELKNANIINEIKQYILEMSKPINPWVLQSRLAALRHMSNPGSYFETSIVLALPDAIGPKLFTPIEGLKPKKALRVPNFPLTIIEPDVSSLSVYSLMWESFMEWRDRAARSLRGIFLQGALMDMWSSRSSGEDPSVDVLSENKDISQSFIRLGRLRNISYALYSRFYDSWTYVCNIMTLPISVGIRTQVRRRMRAIASVNNAKSAAGFPIQQATKALSFVGGFSSSGKQKGTYVDNLPALRASSFGGMTSILSTDVSGMDASLQRPNTDFVDAAACNTLVESGEHSDSYLCFRPGLVECVEFKEGSESNSCFVMASGAIQFIAHSKGACSLRATSIQVQGTKTFGKASKYVDSVPIIIQNSDQTFPSGLPQTSDHHTFLIGTIVGAADKLYTRKYHKPSPIIKQTGLGDDLSLIIYANEKDSKLFIECLRSVFTETGFKIDDAASTRFAEFLQQASYEGRVVGYADRIPLSVSERPDRSANPLAKQSELCALIYDIGNRVPFADNLITYAYNLFFVSFGVIRVSGKIDDISIKICVSSFVRRCLGVILIRSDSFNLTLDTEQLTQTEIMSTLRKYKRVEGVRLILTLFPPIHTPVCWGSSHLPPNKIVCCDGRILPQGCYYMPNGDISEWWKFQVLIPLDTFFQADGGQRDVVAMRSPESLLDSEYGMRMKFDISHRIAMILNDNRLENLRVENQDENFNQSLNVLSSRIRAKRSQRQVQTSITAANLLISKYSLVVPDSFLLASRDRYRLEATVNESGALRSEGYVLRERAFADMSKYLLRSGPSMFTELKGNDAKMMLFSLSFAKSAIERNRMTNKLKEVGFLSPEIRYGSVGGNLWIRLQEQTNSNGSSARIALILAEAYSAWKLTERALDWAKRNKTKLSSPEAIQLFLDALGASSQQKEALVKALLEDRNTLNSRFRVSVPPRQQFMYSGHPLLPLDQVIDSSTLGTDNQNCIAFNRVVGYATLAMFAHLSSDFIPMINRHFALSRLLTSSRV